MDKILDLEERVAFYETIFDELSAAEQDEASCSDEIREKLALLDEYYASGQWLKDFEADEAGLLPADMKRGVLSEDGVYDLLTQLRWHDPV